MNSILVLLIGAAAGSALTFLLVRKAKKTVRAEVAREGQIEITQLNERISAISKELGQCCGALSEREAKFVALQGDLDTAREERAKFEERATRVPALELDLSKCESQMASLREDKSVTAALFQERTNVLEYVTKKVAEAEIEYKANQEELQSLQARLQEESNRVATLTEQVSHMSALEKELVKRATENQELQTQFVDTQNRLVETIAVLDAERRQSVEKLALIIDAKEQLSNQFKSLANDIFEEKTARFTDQNKSNIDQILGPLRLKLQEFQGKVEEVYFQESGDRRALAEKVSQLQTLNQQLSEDAHNLTNALKGSTKTQGNWGELILERVLEGSGLRKGHEYEVRETLFREDGSRAQPDVIVFMPESRHLIVDAKVSLTAYHEHTLAENDFIGQAAITRHIASMRGHIKELSEKNYQTLHGLKSHDFVIMFVPIEPAFNLALAHDGKLLEDAWKKNILLVSPSTLFFVLRTVAHLWRQEQQNRSVQEIVKRGAELYDKLTGFVEDLTEIGKRLTQAKDSYDSGVAKLSAGRGNVIWQAETLKQLGVKPTKSLSPALVELALEASPALLTDDSSDSTQTEIFPVELHADEAV